MAETREIVFNKNYKKLHNQLFCFIKDIIVLKGSELTDNFKKYDTDDDYKIEDNQKYLLLVCLGDEFIPFTTVRKYNKENILKYCDPDKNCYDFKITIKEKEKEQPSPNYWCPMEEK